MAIKERLLKQLQIVRDGLNAMPPFHSRDLNAMRNALVQARDLCFQGLSEKHFTEYKDTYDGLLLAIEQLAVDAPDQGEIVSLCRELLQYTMAQTQKETAFKKELFFLPYKASMWDSLESVWKAADEDLEHCIAYVMPIPYADLTPEHTVAEWHCERGLFPQNVPTVNWEDFDLQEIHPDVIFIHNPYDSYNAVTSVEARYFSGNLKSCTDMLVYIPYYATTGGMAEMQRMCSAYLHADYIVIQSEYFRSLFDASIPDEKFLPFGSPKFDKVLKICQNPPAPPVNWIDKLHGKKVYFYNTSLGGLLANTDAFLEKMKYVFNTFKGRSDVCLLWRPHPLLESTLTSMRREFMPTYDRLKSYFIENQLGIFDDTPNIEKAISLSDAYIGDAATSVTALFGLAGKPMFLFNNLIHSLPGPDDWKGGVNWGFSLEAKDWIIAQGNKLYHAPNHDRRYRYYCNLSPYASGDYYSSVFEINGKVYVCPANAQDILVIGDHKIERRISLERRIENPGAFRGAVHIGNYIFLLPNQYPAIVRFDLKTEHADYIQELNKINVQQIAGEWRFGGIGIWKDYLLLASPSDQHVVALHSQTLQVQILLAGNPDSHCGCIALIPDGDEFWMLPYTGKVITRWDPARGETKEFTDWPADFASHHVPYGHPCEDKPFASGFCDEDHLLLVPWWGNQFLRIHKKTGAMEKWEVPFPVDVRGKNGYFFAGSVGWFGYLPDKKEILFFYVPTRQWYHYNVETKAFSPMEIIFDVDELRQHADGFAELSDWFRYGCYEDAFNSLKDFIDGNITGNPHDKERQIRAFEKIAANPDGTSGEKVYQFVLEKLAKKEE